MANHTVRRKPAKPYPGFPLFRSRDRLRSPPARYRLSSRACLAITIVTTVDAADYIVWSKAQGTAINTLTTTVLVAWWPGTGSLRSVARFWESEQRHQFAGRRRSRSGTGIGIDGDYRDGLVADYAIESKSPPQSSR